MIIECENCFTQYEMDAALPQEGRKVRCARCSHVWTAHPVAEPETDGAHDGESEADNSLEASADDESVEAKTLDKEPGADNNNGMLSGAEMPSVPPLHPDIGSIDDLEFNETAVDDEAAQEDIDALFAAESDQQAEQEMPAEQNADVFDADIEPTPDDAEADAPAEKPADDSTAKESQAEDGLEADDQDFSIEDDDEDLGNEPSAAELSPAISNIGNNASKAPLAATVQAPRRSLGLTAGWGVLTSLVILFVAMAYVFRVDIVRALPGSAGLYAGLGIPVNIRGLEIRNVTFNWETDSGTPILFVQGVIQNISNRHVTIPTVVFAFQDGQGEELYHWAERVKTRTLPAGKQVTFATRVPSPPKAVENLQVRFAKPH